jgi:NADH-quinone oxidoreductase subunit L
LGKFFFDELYVWFVVKPIELAAAVLAWLDRNLIDAMVNFCGWIPRAAGSLFRSLQMGLVQFYALAMLLGMVVLLAAGMVWAGR